MATSSEAFKSFKKAGVVVFANSKTEGGSLPKGIKDVRSAGGNTIPIVFVTSADGEKGIEGISYATLKSDMRSAVRDLRKKLASSDTDTGSSSETPSSGFLAEEQAWTNAEGKSIQAAIKSVDDKNVNFVMPNGTVVAYPLTKLSKESQEAISELK